MVDDNDNDDDGGWRPKRQTPQKSDGYAVGKGKPPREHQFKPGNKSGGRTRGSKNKSSYEKVLDQRVTVGHDALGRPIRKMLRNVIDLQLAKQAGEGDLRAIKISKEFELKLIALERNGGGPELSVQDQIEAMEKEKERQEQSKELQQFVWDMLDISAQLKRVGLTKHVDGRVRFSPRGIAVLNAVDGCEGIITAYIGELDGSADIENNRVPR